MTGYVIFDVGPSDRDAMGPYLDKAFDTITSHGGKLLARTRSSGINPSPSRCAREHTAAPWKWRIPHCTVACYRFHAGIKTSGTRQSSS